MEIIFKKKKEALKNQVALKSLDLDEKQEDFHPEIMAGSLEDKFITISPECVRCNLCAVECPVDAIQEATTNRPARILDNCVKCEICAQTCPVGAVHVMESTSQVDEDVEFRIQDLKTPHRKLRMKEIMVDPAKCKSHAICAQFCPTGAITVEDGEVAIIDKKACVGCGACVSVCPEKAINLERELGPVIKTRELLIDQDTCVQCQVCEENCPVDAIKAGADLVTLDEDKCILCEVCSTKCPVGALKLREVAR
ncbi:4Fe-4S dicluster domain-containing protein [Methanobacterium sp. CWC-01]|uniref:4Fe-4S binding protein n=1 Tax=Methanobacterium aridiramus TaxID=2584467 RepID=UPI0025754E19|nr:4Fe-4S binding protein [Methanobacterium sp. CWC-01]WJI08729.1 4Fe-4S dicluster domain-containing protein [Methanobacterium sp. CWC-01]